MRILADENFLTPIVDELRAYGHDVLWARTDYIGWRDSDLLGLAESESRILLTLDKDFWQIAVRRRTPLREAGVVLFRVQPATPENIKPLVHSFVKANRTWAGHISIIATDGIQMLYSSADRRYLTILNMPPSLTASAKRRSHK